MAKALLDFETISGDEVKAVLRGEKIERRDDDNSKSSAISAVPPSGRTRPREERAPAGWSLSRFRGRGQRVIRTKRP